MYEATNQFLLGIYRNAVALYQPLIERRTGICLGPIEVRDYRFLAADQILAHKQEKHPWWYRLICRSAIEKQFGEYCEHLQTARAERSHSCVAMYFHRTIYVNFAPGQLRHQDGVAFTVVHELAHALWETIAGKSFRQMWPDTEPDKEKFRLLVEGYATYADQIWFKDFYPANVRDAVKYTKQKGGFYDRGREKIAELVDEFGSEVLRIVPNRWWSFCD